MVFALAGDSTITSVLAITTFLARGGGPLDQFSWGAISGYLKRERPEKGREDGISRRTAELQGRPACRKNPAGPSTTTVRKVNINSVVVTTLGGSPERSQTSSRCRAA